MSLKLIVSCLVSALVWSSVGCRSDSDEPKGSAGSAGSAGVGGGDGSAGGAASSPVSVPICLAYCEHYQAACGGADVCDEYCALLQRTPAQCAQNYDSFYECGATATINCAEPLGSSPREGCGYDDLIACVGGPSCKRFTNVDVLCEESYPGTVAYLCTREDAPGCVSLDPESTSRTRCCPPE